MRAGQERGPSGLAKQGRLLSRTATGPEGGAMAVGSFGRRGQPRGAEIAGYASSSMSFIVINIIPLIKVVV